MISKSTLFLIVVATAIIIRIFLIREFEEAAFASVGILGIALTIRYAHWLAKHILPLGLMSFFAKDFKQSASSGTALAFLGWFALLAMLVLVYRQ